MRACTLRKDVPVRTQGLDSYPATCAFPVSVSTVGNLTAQTSYEISAWARTGLGDSPLAFEHIVTKGVRPLAPSLKAKALNQTAVECTWTGPRDVVSEPGVHTPILAQRQL